MWQLRYVPDTSVNILYLQSEEDCSSGLRTVIYLKVNLKLMMPKVKNATGVYICDRDVLRHGCRAVCISNCPNAARSFHELCDI